MSNTSWNLPVIDIEQPEAAAAIVQACKEYGFFVIENHGISEEKIQGLLKATKDFFALPIEQKMELALEDATRGYTPLYGQTLDRVSQARPDTKEGFVIHSSRRDTLVESGVFKAPNRWPSDELLPGWKDLMLDYYNSMQELGLRVVRMIAEGLEMDSEFFVEKCADVMSKMKLIRYTDEVSEPEKGIFAHGGHSDFGMITILATDDVPALEILVEDEWRKVPPRPQGFICNIGNLMQRWTNDHFKSAVHRVVNTSGRVRFSVPFFMDPDNEVEVTCLSRFCSESDPPKHCPTTSGDFIFRSLISTLDDMKAKTLKEIWDQPEIGSS